MFKQKLPKHSFLIFLFLLAAFLRFYNLSTNPPALYWDEASLGYNAFSILKAGIDEHGVKFPITHFLAYGDAKPPLYVYTTAISMFLFGVNEFAIRFSSAFAGTLTVLLTFFLVKELFKDYKFSLSLSQISSLLVAISPWHLQLSRSAFEANLGHFFFIAGFLVFLKSTKRPYLLILSALFFIATLYTFNAYRIFLPPFLILLLAFHYKHIFKHITWSLLSSIVALIVVSPLLLFVITPQAKLRFDEVSIFKDQNPVLEANLRQSLNQNSLWSKIIYNRRFLFAGEFLNGYFDNFKPEFLFFFSDPEPRLSVKDLGALYLIEFPFLIIGFYLISKNSTRQAKFIFAWMLLAVIPSGIAHQTPHALRILQILPTYQIITAFGIIYTYQKLNRLKNKNVRLVLHSLFIILYSSNVAIYLHLCHTHYATQWSNSWQYGYKQLVSYTEAVKNEYDLIFVPQSLGRPHTYVLLYGQYDPTEYLQTRDAGGDAFGFTYTNSFGKYIFTPPSETDFSTKNILMVSTEKPPKDILKTIINLKNEPVFYVYKN